MSSTVPSIDPAWAGQDGESSLDWNGDNSIFVVQDWLPRLNAPSDVLKVIRWAYGYDGSPHSWEMLSDGSTIVSDEAMNGLIKGPPGVAHDYLNRTPNHQTPDEHTWTCAQTNRLYRRACKVFGYSWLRRWVRWVGLQVTGYMIPGRLSWWK